jgi:hypothetical protein
MGRRQRQHDPNLMWVPDFYVRDSQSCRGLPYWKVQRAAWEMNGEVWHLLDGKQGVLIPRDPEAQSAYFGELAMRAEAVDETNW